MANCDRLCCCRYFGCSSARQVLLLVYVSDDRGVDRLADVLPYCQAHLSAAVADLQLVGHASFDLRTSL